MVATSLMDGIGHSVAGGTSIVKRRPYRVGVGSLFAIIYIYLFVYYDSFLGLSSTKVNSSTAAIALDEIPQNIWQIFFGYTPLQDFAPSLQTWIARNQDYSYTLVSNDGANAFAREHYAERPEILQPFLDLKFSVLRSDLLRYMILESMGGVYSDLDTNAHKSVRDWVPKEQKSKVHAVIGIEYDQLDKEPYYGMTERLQFCQWTMATSKGHPIMKAVVEEVVKGLHALAAKNSTSIPELNPNDEEVIEVSGPYIWTKVILKYMSETTGTHIDYRNMTGMKEPRVIADVLVLPIDGFGAGQPHSNSNTDGTGNVYVRHLWKGSWKHGWGT